MDYQRAITTSLPLTFILREGSKEISLTTWWTSNNPLEVRVVNTHTITTNPVNKNLNFNSELCNSYKHRAKRTKTLSGKSNKICQDLRLWFTEVTQEMLDMGLSKLRHPMAKWASLEMLITKWVTILSLALVINNKLTMHMRMQIQAMMMMSLTSIDLA